MEYDKDALQTVRETRLLINSYDEWIFDEFKDFIGQRIVEIGCGLGNQLRYFTDKELVVGIETSKESVEFVRKKFLDYPNIEVENLSITDSKVLSLIQRGFDTAVSLNVFEHIEDDLEAIKNTYRLLLPKGKFILIVPAHQILYGSLDVAIGHYRRYTKLMLKTRMENVGFDVIKLKYLNMLGALGWGINGRILRRHVPPSGQLRFLNYLVPSMRAVEKMIPAPFGVSVLCIAQK